MTFGAVFGFGYPTQCIIIWLIFGAIFLLCCGGWGTKCYIAHKSGHVSINNGDLCKEQMDDCDDSINGESALTDGEPTLTIIASDHGGARLQMNPLASANAGDCAKDGIPTI